MPSTVAKVKRAVRTKAKTKQPATVKRSRNATRSREAILKTAVAHFVEKGYSGARIDEIVSDTDTSKNLVYHYFRSKEDLFVAVLDRIYEDFSRQRGETWREESSPVEGLRKLAGEIFNALAMMPEMISILNTENLFKAVHLRKMARVKEIYHPLLHGLGELLARGEKAGVFRKNIDPIQLYISMSALSYHYISNQHTFSAIFDFDPMSPRKLKTRRDHLVEMTLRFCIKPSAAERLGFPD
jgi:TetR/AcrR family transcriptional regulator